MEHQPVRVSYKTGVDKESLERLLRAQLGFHLTRAEEIGAGRPHNNRLLHLWSTDGREAVAKFYYQDDRSRLDREYTAVTFLHARGIAEVPTPYLRDDAGSVAVYSFETGASLRASELTCAHMDALAEFAASLRRMHPDVPGATFRTSVSSTFSLLDQVTGIRRRLAQFQAFASSPEAFTAVRALTREMDIANEVERLIRRVVAGLTLDAIQDRIPRADWSLTTGDCAPHNLLVRPDGSIRVLDLEYSGWDDPANPMADFLSAESSRGLPLACALTLERTYNELAALSGEEVRRARRVRALMEIGWLALHLSLLVPERFAPKQFADSRFNVQEHVTRQLGHFRSRLATVEPTLTVSWPTPKRAL